MYLWTKRLAHTCRKRTVRFCLEAMSCDFTDDIESANDSFLVRFIASSRTLRYTMAAWWVVGCSDKRHIGWMISKPTDLFQPHEASLVAVAHWARISASCTRPITYCMHGWWAMRQWRLSFCRTSLSSMRGLYWRSEVIRYGLKYSILSTFVILPLDWVSNVWVDPQDGKIYSASLTEVK